MANNYRDRMLTARDPRFAKIHDRLYGRRDMQAPKINPLDHDGDGRPGGSVAQRGADIAAVRLRYTEIVGKRPFNGWDIPTLEAKIAEAQG